MTTSAVSWRAELDARFVERARGWALPPPVRETLVALAEREGALPEPVTAYYCEAQPRTKAEQLARAARLVDHPIELHRMPRLAEALRGLHAVLGADAPRLLGAGMTSPEALIAARPTPAALQRAALFGSGAPILGVDARLAAEAERLGVDAALDWRASGFLVHELCHGLPHDVAAPPAPWTLVEAAALHLGFTARPAHVFPEVAGEALPAVAGFVLVGEALARRLGRRALLGLCLGEPLAGAAGARLVDEGLTLWQRVRSAPFVLDARDALDWARRIEAAAHDVPLGAWPELPWWHEAIGDGDLALLGPAVAALFHHHRVAPALEVVPDDPPEERLFVDPVACTISALPRRHGVFAEPAAWLFPPPAARALVERGARRIVVEGATRARRAELAARLVDLVTGTGPLPREVVLGARSHVALCPLTTAGGWAVARGAAQRAAEALGLFTEQAPITRRMRPLLDLLAHPEEGPSPPLPPAGWGLLAEVMRADRPLPADDAAPGYHEHMRAAGRAAADELARRLPVTGLVLDLGCGVGTYGAAWLAAGNPVWFFDRADVLPLTCAGTRHVAGDLLDGDAPYAEGAALVVLANLLHLHPPADCLRLLGRAAASLAPGGRLVVKDFALADDRSGPRSGLVFALNMALYTAGGDVHPGGVIAGWLAEVGLVGVERFGLAADPEAEVIVGRKP